jgi:hypothetical protein
LYKDIIVLTRDGRIHLSLAKHENEKHAVVKLGDSFVMGNCALPRPLPVILGRYQEPLMSIFNTPRSVDQITNSKRLRRMRKAD